MVILVGMLAASVRAGVELDTLTATRSVTIGSYLLNPNPATADGSSLLVQDNKLVVSPAYWTEMVILSWQQTKMLDLGSPYNMVGGTADDYTNQAWMVIAQCSGQSWSNANYGYYQNGVSNATVYSNMVLVSTNYVLPTIPTNGTVEYRIEPILATNPAVTNVDLLAYISVNGGTNWNDVRWDYQAPLVGNESVVHGVWTVTNQYGKSNLVYRLILTNAPAKGLQERIHAGAFSYSP
jgi:hypothetical protein